MPMLTAYRFIRRLAANFATAGRDAIENEEPEIAAALFTLASRYFLLVGAYREPGIHVRLSDGAVRPSHQRPVSLVSCDVCGARFKLADRCPRCKADYIPF